MRAVLENPDIIREELRLSALHKKAETACIRAQAGHSAAPPREQLGRDQESLAAQQARVSESHIPAFCDYAHRRSGAFTFDEKRLPSHNGPPLLRDARGRDHQWGRRVC